MALEGEATASGNAVLATVARTARTIGDAVLRVS
jgi:hypothetical protein